MPFFGQLFQSVHETNASEDVVAVVLTYRDLATFRAMLGDLPFKHADPICRALQDLATDQQISGLREYAQAAFEKLRERETLEALPVPDGPLN
jgi:hypothetical protein